MVTLEARWGTTASIKLHNSIATAFSVSVIQYTPDLLFVNQRRWKKESRKASYTCTVDSISVFALSSADHRWKMRRYLMKKHLCGKVERTENAILGVSFCFFFFKIKTGTFESVLLRSGFTLSTNPGGTLRLWCIVLMNSQFLCFIVNPTKTFFLEFLKSLNIFFDQRPG